MPNSGLEALQADLAAHKAALADVVERAVALCNAAEEAGHGHWCGVLAEQIASLAAPDAAPYAKVLEAARDLMDNSPIDDNGRPFISEVASREFDALREALAAIGRE